MTLVIGAVKAPRRNFTRVPNDVLDDDSLPGPARWVYAVLARCSAGLRITETALMRKADLGRNVLRRALRALEDRGLITRRQQRRGLGFGDVIVYLGDQPLPMDSPAPADPNPVNSSDQAKHGVSAGEPVDPNPVDCSMYLQDDVPKDEVPSALPRADAAQTSTGGPMPRTRKPQAAGQTSLLPFAVPEPTRDLTPAAADITPSGSSNAGTILGEWLDRCAARPPSRVVGQVAKLVKEMVIEGIDPDLIRRGMAEWMRKGLHPSTLPAEVNSVANRLSAPTRSTTDERVAATLALAARMARSDTPAPAWAITA